MINKKPHNNYDDTYNISVIILLKSKSWQSTIHKTVITMRTC